MNNESTCYKLEDEFQELNLMIWECISDKGNNY
jgi:hypothetical protein